jgi:4-hydroxybenzoate polyprenyltransferase
VAGWLGFCLLAGAVVLAGAGAGARSGIAAGAVALGVLTYDGVSNGGPAGFLVMGATRGLNVCLGATATTIQLQSLPGWAVAILVAIAAYVASVTYLAADEADGIDPRATLVPALGVAVAGATAIVVLGFAGGGVATPGFLVPAVLVVVFLSVTEYSLGRAYADPTPKTVGPVVGTCVLALVVLDAAIAGVAGLGWTLAGLACLVPAIGLSRSFDVS